MTGIDGELFRGSLERLLKTHRGAPPRQRRQTREDVRTVTTGHRSPGDGGHYAAAAAAYARSLDAPVERGPVHHAYQIMSRQVVTLPPTASVEEAWRTLTAHDIGQAPVVDPAHGLVGLVTRERLLRVLNEDDGRLRDVLPRLVSDVMATPIVTADPVTEVRRMARAMVDYAQPALPVRDEEGALVGIVSRTDVLKVVVADPPLALWA